MLYNIINSIKQNEGFAGSPYKDTVGKLTVGYGTKFPISTKEATMILVNRLNNKITDIQKKKPIIKNQPEPIQEVVYEMCYQIGVSGVLKFKNMWLAIENNDYDKMTYEMFHSKWHKQTPNRASILMGKVRKYINDNR